MMVAGKLTEAMRGEDRKTGLGHVRIKSERR